MNKVPFYSNPPLPPPFKNVKLFIYGVILLKFEAHHFHMKHMKMFSFKFEQNRTISEEFNFLKGEGVGARGPHLKILL